MATAYITSLVEKIKTGDPDSLEYKEAVESLREWNKTASKKANYNMRALERADMERYAYGRALNFVQSEYGSNSFVGGKALGLSPQELADQVLELDTFLGRKTSTVRGAKAMEKARGEYLAETMGIDIKGIAKERFGKRAKSAETAFFRFLGTDTVATFLKDVSGFYKVVLEGVATVISESDDKRSTVDRLTQAIDAYLSGEKRYDSLLSELGVSIDELSDTPNIYK